MTASVEQPDPPADSPEARAELLEQLTAIVRGGGDEAPLITLLAESIVAAGDKQDARAKWLGVTSRHLRNLLGDGNRGLGLAKKYPHIRGREQSDWLGPQRRGQ